MLADVTGVTAGRSPLGGRGLKRGPPDTGIADVRSLPTRGAWIETKGRKIENNEYMSLPTRGAWIETHLNARRAAN